MPNSPPRLLLASSGTAALLRLTGKPSLDVSNHLRGVTERLLASGHQQFTVDLKDCPSVDSTFIGVLLFVTKAARRAAPETGRVCLLNAGEQVRRQIDTLGVLDRFDLAEADASGVRFEALPVSAASKAENTRVCLEAHRALIEACAANAAKFHDVIQFLEADLRGPASTAPPSMKPTIFERICTREIPANIVYEDEHVVAFRDLNPQAPTHVLVVPRRPIPRLSEATAADQALLGHLMLKAAEVARQLGLAGGYRLVINCGPDAGESVPHLHCHVLGGRSLEWPPG